MIKFTHCKVSKFVNPRSATLNFWLMNFYSPSHLTSLDNTFPEYNLQLHVVRDDLLFQKPHHLRIIYLSWLQFKIHSWLVHSYRSWVQLAVNKLVITCVNFSNHKMKSTVHENLQKKFLLYRHLWTTVLTNNFLHCSFASKHLPFLSSVKKGFPEN